MESHSVIRRNEILMKAIMWMSLKNIMLSENTWCKGLHLYFLFLWLLSVFSLCLIATGIMLYLHVFLFVFILLRVLCTSRIRVVVFLVNFRNVCRYFFYPALSLFSFCNSNNTLNCFTSSCRSHVQFSFYASFSFSLCMFGYFLLICLRVLLLFPLWCTIC